MMRVDIKLPANNKKKRHLRVRMYMGGLHKASGMTQESHGGFTDALRPVLGLERKRPLSAFNKQDNVSLQIIHPSPNYLAHRIGLECDRVGSYGGSQCNNKKKLQDKKCKGGK